MRYWYVDAGMLANGHIMHRYYETIKLLQQWGCKTRVGWWGQFTKEDPDIDDLIIQGGRYQSNRSGGVEVRAPKIATRIW